MVVMLPKEDEELQVLAMPAYFEDYAMAFEYINELIAEERDQVLKQPKGEKPVKVSLNDMFLELWIINRADELLTA